MTFAVATITTAGVAFGIASAAAAGIGDFVGGEAARRSTAWGVAAVTWLGQIPILVLVAIVLEESLDASVVVPGMVAGVVGAASGVFLFAGIARGNVAIVAATSAVLASVTAVAYDVTQGVELPTQAWVGIVLAMPAIVLVVGGAGELWGASLSGLGAGVGAGVSLGVFYVMLGSVGGEEGDPTVLIVIAATAGLLLAATASLRRGAVMPRGTALGISIGSAMLASLHLLLFVFAVEFGSIATGTVLISQYPAFTVLMAAAFWRQRPTTSQTAGLVVALIAVGLIASGSV